MNANWGGASAEKHDSNFPVTHHTTLAIWALHFMVRQRSGPGRLFELTARKWEKCAAGDVLFKGRLVENPMDDNWREVFQHPLDVQSRGSSDMII